MLESERADIKFEFQEHLLGGVSKRITTTWRRCHPIISMLRSFLPGVN